MSRPSDRTFGPWLALGILLILAVASVSALRRSPRPAPEGQDPRRPPAAGPAEEGRLVFAEYALGPDAVIDGDTLKMPDEIRVRVRGLDTEEVFRHPRARQEAESDFERYARDQRGSSAHPVKFGTPAGEAATLAARRLVASVVTVRLEIDDPAVSPEDAFGRYLLHVVLIGPEGERLFAEEMIREGHSPYYEKYGRVLRYHARLAAAEAEARRAGRGIWGKEGPAHYPDYSERLAWWRARAAQVEAWRAGGETADRVSLDRKDAAERLAALVGRKGTVFGVVRARKADGRPRILWLRHEHRNDFPVVVFEEDVWAALDLPEIDRWFLTVTGPVSLYRGEPQIVVRDPAQISID